MRSWSLLLDALGRPARRRGGHSHRAAPARLAPPRTPAAADATGAASWRRVSRQNRSWRSGIRTSGSRRCRDGLAARIGKIRLLVTWRRVELIREKVRVRLSEKLAHVWHIGRAEHAARANQFAGRHLVELAGGEVDLVVRVSACREVRLRRRQQVTPSVEPAHAQEGLHLVPVVDPREDLLNASDPRLRIGPRPQVDTLVYSIARAIHLHQAQAGQQRSAAASGAEQYATGIASGSSGIRRRCNSTGHPGQLLAAWRAAHLHRVERHRSSEAAPTDGRRLLPPLMWQGRPC